MLEVVSNRLSWLVLALPLIACGGDAAPSGAMQSSEVTAQAGSGGRASIAASREAERGGLVSAGAGAGARAGVGGASGSRANTGTAAGAGGTASSEGSAAGGSRANGGGAQPVGGEPGAFASEGGTGGHSVSVAGHAASGGAGSGASGKQGASGVPQGGQGGQPRAGQGGGGMAQAGDGGQGGMPSPPPAADLDPNAQLGNTGLRLADVLGYYSGEWGELAFELHGPEVWGSYSRDAGTLVVTPRADGVLVGWWSEAPSRAAPSGAGELELRFARGGDVISVAGRFRDGSMGAFRDELSLLLVNGQSAPAELSDRFADSSAFLRHP